MGRCTFKREISEQSHVFGPFAAFCKRGEDEESSPALSHGAHTYALYSYSERVEIACGNDTALDHT